MSGRIEPTDEHVQHSIQLNKLAWRIKVATGSTVDANGQIADDNLVEAKLDRLIAFFLKNASEAEDTADHRRQLLTWHSDYHSPFWVGEEVEAWNGKTVTIVGLDRDEVCVRRSDGTRLWIPTTAVQRKRTGDELFRRDPS